MSKRDTSLKSYFTTVGLSNVKTVADRHRLVAYDNKNSDKLLMGINIDDLERF